MSVYARRRIAALCLLALVLGGVYALATRGGGASSAASSAGGTDTTAVASTGRHGASELAAALPAGTVALPSVTRGDGPFLVAHGKTLERVRGKAGGQVALTFDDGPGPQTLDVLAELQREHAVATFFVMGSHAAGDPATVKALYDAGMQIGNHTWTHPQLARLSASKQLSELKRTQDEIASIIGVRPRFYRPPYWSWNYLTTREGAELGMIGTMFSVDTGDWKKPGTNAIITAALRARDGDVIAFHDAGGDRSQTVDSIAPIIVGLRALHLEPVTLDRLYGGTSG
jgi:peptidoglycan/xylan/chitin deacetylase (PgdA/CDA1 family)